MRLTVKKHWSILLFAIGIFFILNSFFPTGPQNVEAQLNKSLIAINTEDLKSNKSSSESQEKAIFKQPERVEQVGEKVAQNIDILSKKASSYFGSWVNRFAIAGITWFELIICLLLIFVVLLFERIVRLFIDRERKKTKREKETKIIKHLIVEAVGKPLSLFIWVYGIYIVLIPLIENFQKPDGTNLIHNIIQKTADFGATVALIWFIFKMVSIVDFRLNKWAISTDSDIDDVLAPLVGKTLRFFIVIIGGIIIIQNLTGVEIGPVLASLGIGGIAIALAAKDSIANFFGTLTILFDKPFKLGERILIDNYDGVVEDVGFRSTRIRTLTGHLVTIPNEKVVNSALENIGKRPHIRWLTNITITYDTTPELVERAVSNIKKILENHEGIHPDFPPRVYFNGFNDWSLNIMVIAWYHPANYWDYQEWLQQISLEILRRFKTEGIDFAFPSRSVYVANDDKRQLKLKMIQGETLTYTPEGGSHE